MTKKTKQSRAFSINETIGISGLSVRPAPIPTPAPGEVLVHVRASSLNYRDLIILEGNYNISIPAGRIPLSDGAGEVVAVGQGVTRFKIGDRVTNSFFPEWIDGPFTGKYSQYSGDVDGWLADYRTVAADSLISIPDSLDFDAAATLPCAGVTAWSAIKGVKAGDTVLTLGTGGVSLFAVQLAKAMGARVIATTSSDTKAEQLKALGADEAINYKEHPEWSQQVRELTDGYGVNRIVEVGGPGTFEQSIKAIAVGGQVSIVGVVAGLQGTIEFMSMFRSHAHYQCIALGSRQDLEDLVRFITEHNIHPIIDSRFAFDDAKLAFERLMTRNVFGKIVVNN
ncbi:NAD(P)-dependent alcohol dehydrogenase [Pectobacterium quasiaquaticum]|uniref:NAD(P)-dependent alcohol dehydrogenase n=1 Tax=Pectobacterium quasiaquaticum TaxID=2774015 RepID=A0A9Q2IAC2_9GAMM|nr:MULTISPECIES: NAD(P)-dependent alcohol dehydrogenase [Pectobacterium]PLY36755.1 alcohol dehydrogenase [Pectobacterium carotovorum]MBE5202441.1 NAD(P)-dependent alcohol dehydrogenase [Pectobacterium quasiaquaticum]MBE5209510.1 NAD(P)-dependent alcohol dehydrogenase [Pectobacterium quasiaquaticum]MBE5212621.1 NAD(P)-dependent alcohol dehydrogenase [Pectobacterium quasiaquaticum]MBE5222089.1 NAD(P)-dependent alcohol dehydrogenase [Pectobacterium quasiaquaticum]